MSQDKTRTLTDSELEKISSGTKGSDPTPKEMVSGGGTPNGDYAPDNDLPLNPAV